MRTLVLVDAERIHHVLNALRTEQTHQIVLERNIEAGLAGVALTAGTAAQLVVDTAGLVALGAEDIQTASRAHLFRVCVGLRLVQLVQLVELLAYRKNARVVGLRMAVCLVDHLVYEHLRRTLVQLALLHLALGQLDEAALEVVERQRLGVHVGKGEHLFGVVILHDGRNEALFIKFQFHNLLLPLKGDTYSLS